MQIICARLKILGMRPGRGLLAVDGVAAMDDAYRSELAPRILKGVWEHDPTQKHLFQRLRCAVACSCDAVPVLPLWVHEASHEHWS